MIAAHGSPQKDSPVKIKLEEDCNEIHDNLVLSVWKHP
jgi:hypothetical protein